MKNKLSIYQTIEYGGALFDAGEKIIKVSDRFYAVEKIIKSLIGKKKIIEAWGTPSLKDAAEFKKKAKNYFYGTIAPTVINVREEIFEKLGFRKVSNYTVLINLKKTEEELRKVLEKKSIRWGVKTAEKNRLKFELVRIKKDINEFYELYEKTAKIGGFKAESKVFIFSLINTNIAKLFIIRKGRRIIAGGMILIDKENNYSILDLTSSSEEGLKLQAMPFLYWKLMLYSKEIGMGWFDLGGYDKEAKKGDKTYNINKFKERFGGEIREQPIYATNWKYPFLRGLMRRFKFLKKLYKK